MTLWKHTPRFDLTRMYSGVGFVSRALRTGYWLRLYSDRILPYSIVSHAPTQEYIRIHQDTLRIQSHRKCTQISLIENTPSPIIMPSGERAHKGVPGVSEVGTGEIELASASTRPARRVTHTAPQHVSRSWRSKTDARRSRYASIRLRARPAQTLCRTR